MRWRNGKDAPGDFRLRGDVFQKEASLGSGWDRLIFGKNLMRFCLFFLMAIWMQPQFTRLRVPR